MVASAAGSRRMVMPRDSRNLSSMLLNLGSCAYRVTGPGTLDEESLGARKMFARSRKMTR